MMNSNPEQQIEILFNSVEAELIRRRAVGEVPAALSTRPADVTKSIVKGWWQLYHESDAIVKCYNRKVWVRSQSLPANALDTPALIGALKSIHDLINTEAIENFRVMEKGEKSAVALLFAIARYYVQLMNPIPGYGN